MHRPVTGRRIVRRLVAGSGVVAIVVAFGAGSAVSDDPTPPFSGGASAAGVRLTVNIPGAPATDTPVDAGGPTAQVVVDSIGTSQGYAAFPDPGQFVTSVPGLVVGLLSGGAAGLPPIALPSPPNYPLFVSSDAAGNPDASVGSGPLALAASSRPGTSSASASAGFQSGLVGNAALATSTASVTAAADGSVRATAVTDVQGLTIGPLTLGEIKASATETIDSSGAVTPTQGLSIGAVRIGGVSVELNPTGLVVAGPTIPVAVNASLATLLKAAGVSLRFVAPQQFAGKVVSPALEVSYPFVTPDVPNVGSFHGTATLIIGAATAQMSGATPGTPGAGAGSGAGGLPAAGGSGGSPLSSPALSPVLSSPVLSSPSGSSPSGSSPSGSSPLLSSPVASSSPGVGVEPSLPAAVSPAVVPASAVGSPKGFDVESLYLIVILGALAASAAGALIRRVGVRT